MKKMMLAALAVAALAVPSHAAGPYVQGLWSKGNPVYTSAGVTFTTDKFVADKAITSVAVVYHPMSAGSLWDLPFIADRTPDWAKPLVPREAWACQVGGVLGKGAAGNLSGNGAVGCGINLLASARQEIAGLLGRWDKTAALAAQIKPGDGPGDIFVGRLWQDDASRPLVLVPRWEIAAAYRFGGQ
jgi:hypothetical protein